MATKKNARGTEAPQKVEISPESIRKGNMQAQAGIGTKTDAFVFYAFDRSVIKAQFDLDKSLLRPTFADLIYNKIPDSKSD